MAVSGNQNKPRTGASKATPSERLPPDLSTRRCELTWAAVMTHMLQLEGGNCLIFHASICAFSGRRRSLPTFGSRTSAAVRSRRKDLASYQLRARAGHRQGSVYPSCRPNAGHQGRAEHALACSWLSKQDCHAARGVGIIQLSSGTDARASSHC